MQPHPTCNTNGNAWFQLALAHETMMKAAHFWSFDFLKQKNCVKFFTFWILAHNLDKKWYEIWLKKWSNSHIHSTFFIIVFFEVVFEVQGFLKTKTTNCTPKMTKWAQNLGTKLAIWCFVVCCAKKTACRNFPDQRFFKKKTLEMRCIWVCEGENDWFSNENPQKVRMSNKQQLHITLQFSIFSTAAISHARART